MDEAANLPIDALQASLTRDGFAFVRATAMQDMLARSGELSDWTGFAASWDDLRLDTYMADRGRYRKRRHAVYAAQGGTIVRQPHQPHFQSLAYNPIHGDIERWFAPILPAIGDGPSMRTILGFSRALFGAMAPGTGAWRIEVHQFRIEARPGEEGRPTPEGAHRDGVDYVLVLLIRRHNIAQGATSIQALDDRRLLGSFTLTDPFDAALVDDGRVYHGVTPVEPLDPDHPAYRDVLVVTFRHA
jgi:hypothetical protein